MVEQRPFKALVDGSSPSRSTTIMKRNQFVTASDVSIVRWDKNKDVHNFMASAAGKAPEILEYVGIDHNILDRFKKAVLDLEIKGDLEDNLRFIKQGEILLKKGFQLVYHNW